MNVLRCGILVLSLFCSTCDGEDMLRAEALKFSAGLGYKAVSISCEPSTIGNETSVSCILRYEASSGIIKTVYIDCIEHIGCHQNNLE